jgi:hypothetical protein
MWTAGPSDIQPLYKHKVHDVLEIEVKCYTAECTEQDIVINRPDMPINTEETKNMRVTDVAIPVSSDVNRNRYNKQVINM